MTSRMETLEYFLGKTDSTATIFLNGKKKYVLTLKVFGDTEKSFESKYLEKCVDDAVIYFERDFAKAEAERNQEN